MSTMRRICSRVSRRKITVSSIRFRNSGRNTPASTDSTRRRTSSSSHLLDDELGSGVRRHDQDRVREIDRATLAIGQPAVVEHLQQDVEDVGVRLLDLVEQDDAVRPSPDGLGQLTALVVADVAGRCPDEPGDGVLLHVLGHVDPDDGPLAVEEEVGERLRKLGLPDAGRSEEQERAERAVRILKPGPGTPDRVRDGGDCLVLSDDALVEPLLEVDELLHLAFEQLVDRDPGPGGDDGRHVLGETSSLSPPSDAASAAAPSASCRSRPGMLP